MRVTTSFRYTMAVEGGADPLSELPPSGVLGDEPMLLAVLPAVELAVAIAEVFGCVPALMMMSAN